ncbi:MAG: hypothetical protein LBM93_00620 [Oscillospiraceae bacterium]|jgi:type III restriction enzyme|nr:hypothetical protein [Oscillospiraceae bacterium]
MKLKFKNQTFQTEAVNAVVSLFEGQPHRQDTFTIINSSQLNLDSTGVRNNISITNEQLIENMHRVQERYSLPLTSDNIAIPVGTVTFSTYFVAD